MLVPSEALVFSILIVNTISCPSSAVSSSTDFEIATSKALGITVAVPVLFEALSSVSVKLIKVALLSMLVPAVPEFIVA